MSRMSELAADVDEMFERFMRSDSFVRKQSKGMRTAFKIAFEAGVMAALEKEVNDELLQHELGRSGGGEGVCAQQLQGEFVAQHGNRSQRHKPQLQGGD